MSFDNKKVKNDPTQEKIKFILELFNSNKLIETKKEIEKLLERSPKQRAVYEFICKGQTTISVLNNKIPGSSQIIKSLLAPFYKFVTFPVASKFHFHIFL